MPLSKIVKATCKDCGEVAIEKGRIKIGSRNLIQLKCGHSYYHETKESAVASYEEITATNGDKLFPFQVEGVKFLEAANGRALIADEQGLGKTVQDLAFLGLHAECFPVIHVTKSALTSQMYWEITRWLTPLLQRKPLIQILRSGKEKALPGMDLYVMSYDILKVEGILDWVSYKTLVFDEVQAIKNHLSGRAKAAQDASLKAEYILAMSGTPIKNNAGEYFTILNILKPERFPEYRSYLKNYCDHYDSQHGVKVGGLLDEKFFRENTGDFVIRRTQKEVLPDLPVLRRNFHHVELNSKFNPAYSKALEELDEIFYQEDEDSLPSMIAIMTKLRRICGLSKTLECVEFVVDFLNNHPDEKIAIFCHHHDVVTLLESRLNSVLSELSEGNTLNYISGMDGTEFVKKFKDSNSRVAILSTLAAGEGLDGLQRFCHNAIMLERQWNPANEEQTEKRFQRIGQQEKVTFTYMLATETIDDFFTDLVEQKRAIVANTLDGTVVDWQANSLVKELAAVLIAKGAKKWKL